MRLPFFTVDVFTTARFAGNPLAIVEEADRLSTEAMQRLAREFNLSETIFVMAPDNPAHTAKVRIFFPTAEIPFAGHPTIGCAIHLALKRHSGDGDFESLVTLEEVAGLVPVKVWRRQGEVGAQFTAPVIPYAHPGVVPNVAAAAAAVGMEPVEIGFAGHRIGLWAGGPAFLYLPVASRDVLRRAGPREPYWSAMIRAANVDSAYLYCADGQGGFAARMFSPTAGIPEDPATGSASAILAAQLKAAGELADGTSAFALLQGEDMGRPSQIGLEIDMSGGVIAAVRVSGASVPVSEGWVEVD